jgi:UDP-2,3-diacylglucosamine hydrolase
MKDIFLADAHLGSPDDPNYRYLLDFLDGLCGEVRNLFLLGDLFEFWSNFKHAPTNYHPVLETLDKLIAAGANITWVEGNHDFHLQRYFGKRTGYRILPDGGKVELDGKQIYIGHGDLVDRNNHNYLKLRKVLRSGVIAWLTGILPLSVLDKIAARMSNESKKRRRTYDRRAELAPMLEAHAERMIEDGVSAVFTGHYHTPMEKNLPGGVMIALGDWIHDYSYAVHEDGNFSLKSYPAGSSSTA